MHLAPSRVEPAASLAVSVAHHENARANREDVAAKGDVLVVWDLDHTNASARRRWQPSGSSHPSSSRRSAPATARQCAARPPQTPTREGSAWSGCRDDRGGG